MKREKLLIVIGICVVLVIGAYLVYDAQLPNQPDQIMFPEDSVTIISRYPEMVRAAEELSGECITEINSFTLEYINELKLQDPLDLRKYEAIDNDIIDAILRYKNVLHKGS